jgi:hypothetical protein
MRSTNGVSGGVSDEAPIEMAGVTEELKFVAMYAVAIIGEKVEEGDEGGDGQQRKDFRARRDIRGA